MNIIGLSCFYHDSAACLVQDGAIVAAAEEERFTRKKHDNAFPENSINYCLKEANLTAEEIDKIVFYEKPILKFERILNTTGKTFPRGYKQYSRALPEWLGTKLRIRRDIRKLFEDAEIEFLEHHHSHAASAFYPSPFDEAAILTVDGVGEWTTNQMFYGENDDITPLKHIEFPDSLGLLYSTITAYLGFMVNNDEYKVMGLASYGSSSYREEFDEVIEINSDGSYKMDQSFFGYRYSKKMWTRKIENLLGEPRSEGEELTQRHKDIAATLQEIAEEILLKQCRTLHKETGSKNLCMAGGVALNSVANGRILEESPFENVWIQPAAGDDGGAMGAALERSDVKDTLQDVYLGPAYSKEEERRALDELGATYTEKNEDELVSETAKRIADGQVVGLFQGRMEWGPRALGNRSILADPTDPEMVDRVNQKVKFRESFRPFAPVVLEDRQSDYFDIGTESPYMLFVCDVKEDKKKAIPSVTHVNGTSRIQTVKLETNPFYYSIIEKFGELTGVPVLLNTSFNLKGMPIVNTPKEAYSCFKESGMDAMVTRHFIVDE